ncbi:hypothetical protein B0H16DRAFT_1469149 [Mycena metata]|uniref:Uncharacterized protein n=1 Tax=Mycena metata TaxID=1033252 RepID=A0AAD7HZ56_9AGAR|nr:hypothetical protein B0H16DRAFT_1469149 [Mycena metata]
MRFRALELRRQRIVGCLYEGFLKLRVNVAYQDSTSPFHDLRCQEDRGTPLNKTAPTALCARRFLPQLCGESRGPFDSGHRHVGWTSFFCRTNGAEGTMKPLGVDVIRGGEFMPYWMRKGKSRNTAHVRNRNFEYGVKKELEAASKRNSSCAVTGEKRTREAQESRVNERMRPTRDVSSGRQKKSGNQVTGQGSFGGFCTLYGPSSASERNGEPIDEALGGESGFANARAMGRGTVPIRGMCSQRPARHQPRIGTVYHGLADQNKDSAGDSANKRYRGCALQSVIDALQSDDNECGSKWGGADIEG